MPDIAAEPKTTQPTPAPAHQRAPQPQLVTAAPAESPRSAGRLEIQPPHPLAFASVERQVSASQTLTISNPTAQAIGIVPEIEGPDAGAFSHDGHALLTVNPESGPNKLVQIQVRYKPSKPGRHTATLVIRDRSGGRYAVPLAGTALASSDTAAYRDDGEHDMTVNDVEVKAPRSRKEAKAQLGEAVDAVAQIPRAFNRMSDANDKATETFSSNLASAAASLTTRLSNWVAQEGIAGVQSFKEHAANPLLNFILDQVVQNGLEHAGPLGKLASIAVDVAFLVKDVMDTGEDNAKADRESGRLKQLAAMAGNEIGSSTRMFMDMYGSVKEHHGRARGRCAQLASARTSKLLEAIASASSRPTVSEQDAQQLMTRAKELVDEFQVAQAGYAQAFRSFAGAGLSAQRVADGAFRRVLDRYLAYRVTGSSKPTEDEAKKKTIEGRGWINFEVARSTSENNLSVGYDARFGSYAPESETMSRHLSEKNIWGQSGWNVKISLRTSTGAGGVLLQQAADGSRQLLPYGDAVEQVRRVGKDAIWREVVSHR